MKKEQKVLVIVGPTSSGKSSLGITLAKTFDGEIISADSRQVYRGLDIGTGKVTRAEMKGVPHHLLDVASPKKALTAHRFATKARRAVAQIIARKKLPIVVGGTGFYIDALLGRMDLPDVPPNIALRKRLQKKSAVELYKLLKTKDPVRAKAMNTPSERNNKVRIIRALEVAASKSKHLSQGIKGSPLSPLSRTTMPGRAKGAPFWIGIAPPFHELERKIKLRLAARIRRGMIAEARRLHDAGLSYKRMEELGLEYRWLALLLQKKVTRNEFEAGLYRDIRRYAKRQLSYWKRNKDIRWYDPKQTKQIARDVASSLKIG